MPNTEAVNLIVNYLSKYPPEMLIAASKISSARTSDAYMSKRIYDVKEQMALENSELSHFWVTDDSRFSLFPLRFSDVWKSYKDQLKGFWTAGDITFEKDNFSELPLDIKNVFLNIFGVFTVADGLVGENLIENVIPRVKNPEARCGYMYQCMIENIHAEMYGLIAERNLSDREERQMVFKSIHKMPAVKLLTDWIQQYMEGSLGLAQNLVAFVIVESLMFPIMFAFIFWAKNKNYQLQGLYDSNSLISIDEWSHVFFSGAVIYQKYFPDHLKLPQDLVVCMVDKSIKIQKDFITESFGGHRFDGMNEALMHEYTEFMGDNTLQIFGFEKYYGTACPFHFMENIGMQKITDFFTKRPMQYSRPVELGEDSSLSVIEGEY